MKRPPSVNAIGPDTPTRVVLSSDTGGASEQSSQSPDASVAAVFGRYEVRHKLGKGGFGEIYLGQDTQLNRQVAIRVMPAEFTQPGPAVDHALREARKLVQLRHPGIVTVHDVGVQDGQVYIVSDYLEGVDLGRWSREHRPSWREAAQIVAAVAEALAHAHGRLIVHRDVKPDNIIVTGGQAPVLVDFGLVLADDQAASSETGFVSGTPWYMSPEQALGAAHRIDGRTDVYSLGIVFYELLSGRVPFQSNTLPELFRQVCEDEPQPPRQLVPEIPAGLERACLKMLAKRQQDRYTTAGDFADDLRRILQTETAAPISRQTGAEHSLDQGALTQPAIRVEPSTPPSVRRAREAERRQLTVLVCGCTLFDSEAYLELDAEDQTRALRSFQESCEDAVNRLGGTLVQCDEKGLLVCFGFPVAFEDSAIRAVGTAIGLLDGLKMLGDRFREDKLDLNPWVGIHTGAAVVESKDGVVSLVGEARNVAVRLGEVAVDGQVICTEATHRLLQGQFHCSSLGRKKVKGAGQPIEVFQVERIASTGGRFEGVAPVELSPLTGRDQEISLLKDRWELAQEGMGQVVLLIGEPGLGKSRLVHTMKQHVLGQMEEGEVDAPVIEWRCSPHFQNTGFYPAIDFYERALGFGREQPPQDRFNRLLHRLEQYNLAQPETVPIWASLLSLPIPERFPSLPLSPVRQREETFRTILDWLHTRASRKPVLFVVEDLHWVDASTLEFLGQFLAEGLHESILTVLTFRPEFETPWPAIAHQTSLALNRLTRRQVGDLMRKKVGRTIPEMLVEQIYDRTAGVPLFVEEFTKMVQESGALATGEQADALRALLKREIPATLQDLMMARLDRMDGEREVAQLAATLGREFSYDVLAAVSTLDEATLQAELTKLVQAEILYSKGKPPRCNYIFKHGLLEGSAYNSLVKGKRQQFHKRIAEVMESQFGQTVDTQPELVAHHFTEAGLAEKGAAYWLKAGLRSRDRSANVEAIGQLTKGLAVLAMLEESLERDSRELEFLNLLGPTYQSARGYSAVEVFPVFERARELCRRTGKPQQMFMTMWGNWAFHIVRGEFTLCTNLAAELMKVARDLNDQGIMMEALYSQGVTRFYRGDFARAHEDCTQAINEFDDQERTKAWAVLTHHNSSIMHRCYLAMSLWHLGYPDQAKHAIREALEMARANGQPFGLCIALHQAGWLHYDCGLGVEAQAAGDEELQLASKHGFPMWEATGGFWTGAGLLRQGLLNEALPFLEQGLKSYRSTGSAISLSHYLGILGEACTKAGRFAEARQALDEGITVAHNNDERYQEAELHRLRGELHLAETNDQTAAEDCFRRAIQTARGQQSKAWELRATLGLTRLRQRRGGRVDAREALAAIYATYTEGFTTPDLVEAKTLLDHPGSRT